MPHFNNEPIAIVGTGCRFPGNASTASKLWDLLTKPTDLSSEIPSSRFNSSGFYHQEGAHHGTSNVRKSYFLEEDVRLFDSQFFNISTAEAESMDAQQRQLLEVVFEAMESANMTMEQMRGSPTAVYVGLMCDDYSGLIFSDMESVPTYGATGAARSILSNRISYFYDWTGPSYTIDSACSSSLVAVHQAVQQLRNGECSVALAAGANLILSPRMFIAESKLNMLSPNGRSRMWDANGDGYARGEGIAAVLMKRLSDAIADGDHIECVIRESHVNQGGRSSGLTVPNPVAQVNLIRQTYAKAGLDLRRPQDRPQYFQAHGTGTKVGDLNEATAIHKTFFSMEEAAQQDDLFVGSVKTIIGHSEGAAGIAGLLEACLAVRHGVIPPNLHFETLNPKLEPFYEHLKVPTETKPWPMTYGGVRRASVNSFGFGGTNAHVILENHVPASLDIGVTGAPQLVHLPVTFSAASDRSLGLLLAKYMEYLNENPETDFDALTRTLLTRRSVFTHKIAFAAQTASELYSKMKSELDQRTKEISRTIVSRPLMRPKHLLGNFTGQGAQWASMGWDLVCASSKATETLASLQESLDSLPAEHRPSWSLQAELATSALTSRIGEAVISQPLCTAVQILLVDHLYAAGVRFSAVVGHSSGEIAAAYAAGFISADAAIKIAYYRGYYAHLAGNGKSGSMLAVGASMIEAVELCQLPQFCGRISVAASNSLNSVTLSGDSDAIEEVKQYFDKKSVFARILKVDTAYHSTHMLACSVPYLQALKDCNIQVQQGHDEACLWFSSVNGGKIVSATDALQGTYWMENMLQPVLFSQAVTQACKTIGSFDFALEVGPHPALKGPALQTLSENSTSAKPVPYEPLLARGQSAVQTFAAALGSLWLYFGSGAFDVEAYSKLFGDSKQKLLTGLPTYPWNHDRAFWYESRSSREFRLRPDPPHPLLGTVASDQAEGEYTWRNYLRLGEIPWLSGHKIQGQTIFPAAGYIVMALEAAKLACRGKDVNLFEIQDLKILQAISINDDADGVETLVGVRGVKWDEDAGMIRARFTCHACLSRDTGGLVLVCSGQLLVRFGDQMADMLPARGMKAITDLRDVDVGVFYDSLATIGYGYTGLFKAISSLQQKLDISTGLIDDANFGVQNDGFDGKLLVHPASLDAAIQTLFACLGSPGDGSLWSMHVPVSISRVRINPLLCDTSTRRGKMRFDARIEDTAGGRGVLRGDVMLYDTGVAQDAILQMEGVEVKPLMPATPADDRHLFYELAWGLAEPDASLVFRRSPFSAREMEKAEVLEMLCFFYFKQLDEFVMCMTAVERDAVSWHGNHILASVKSILDATIEGRHATCKPDWIKNTWEYVQARSMPFESEVDFKLTHVVGSKLIPFMRNETTILEHMVHDGLLDSFYQNSELLEYNEYAGKLAAQIAFRYPRIRVLEIGAGTGGVTRAVLRHLENKYLSYTFTDISISFFEQAKEKFKDNERMIYAPLDIALDPTTQGFDPSSYDLVIASNVLHATPHLATTLAHANKLLKPGGKVLVLEAVDNGCVRVGFSFCGVPGWWAAEDGRIGGPLITVDEWGSLLKENGFAGIDTVTPGAGGREQPVAVFVATKVDDTMSMLREPLNCLDVKRRNIGSVVLVGGVTLATQDLIEGLKTLLRPWSSNIQVVRYLDELDTSKISGNGGLVHVLNISDLDAPFFKDPTPTRLEGLKGLLDKARSFIWVTQGARGSNPWASMVLGIGRTLVHEMPHVRVQVLDLDDKNLPQDLARQNDEKAKLLAEAFLRVVLVEKWGNGVGEGHEGNVWSNECELWLKNGRWEVTRVRKEKEANLRLMSGRRVVEEVVDLGCMDGEAVDAVVQDDGGYELARGMAGPINNGISGQNVQIKVTNSTLLAAKVGDGYLYLITGEMIEDGTRVIALSESVRSTISTHHNWILPWHIVPGQEPALLSAVFWDIIAKNILDSTRRNKTLVLFEPEVELANALVRKGRFGSVRLCFVTAKARAHSPQWCRIHPFSSVHDIKAMLPKNIGAFVDCSVSVTRQSEDLACSLRMSLPAFCRKLDVSDLFNFSSLMESEMPMDVAGDILRVAVVNSMSSLVSVKGPVSHEIISPASLSSINNTDLRLRIVNWTSATELGVRVRSAENIMRFDPNKTYLLIGLSGNLGRSLCRWMILHGARYIVLTSRKPSIEQAWLDEMVELGGQISVMAMDVADKVSLELTIKMIEATLPPIAGVANAAMVLSDTLLSNMSLQEMQTVLNPKVSGSQHLSSLFESPSRPLDFFILFGSSVDIMGNSGQAAYCAANMFMHGLICQRRSKGLVGSLIGLGEVKGVGYAARREKEGGGRLNRIIGETLPLSEREVLVMFAEGVLAGRVGKKGVEDKNPVLYAGMVGKDPARDPGMSWYEHAKFWHYIEASSSSSASSTSSTTANVSLKSQLALATSTSVVRTLVLEAFIEKLKHKLQISDTTVVDEGKVLLELGIDSLVAVDLRAWFVVEVGVDMPILKILGGGSVGDVVGDAVGRLDEKMVPLLEKREEGKLIPNGLGGFHVVQVAQVHEIQDAAVVAVNEVVEVSEDIVLPGADASLDVMHDEVRHIEEVVEASSDVVLSTTETDIDSEAIQDEVKKPIDEVVEVSSDAVLSGTDTILDVSQEPGTDNTCTLEAIQEEAEPSVPAIDVDILVPDLPNSSSPSPSPEGTDLTIGDIPEVDVLIPRGPQSSSATCEAVEITAISDSEGEAVLVRLISHVKKESISTVGSSDTNADEDADGDRDQLDDLSGPISPTFSDATSFGDEVVGETVEIVETVEGMEAGGEKEVTSEGELP